MSQVVEKPGSGPAHAAPTTGADPVLDALAAELLQSYRGDPRGHRIGKRYLPSRDEIVEIIGLFLRLFFPGYFERTRLDDDNVGRHTAALLATLHEKLERQIEQCLCHAAESEQEDSPCAGAAAEKTTAMMRTLPRLRALLIDDAQAAYEGDPAATNLHEVILAYPGMLAIAVHRVAHELALLGVPLLPRIMSEWAHTETGADIHPGATIGRSFFIDHATGVVVGETSQIGDHVKLYQGVTLGAISHPRDEEGRIIRDQKRHPTVEDDVTIYANATVLGGQTTLGKASLVGGSVFITRSIPEGARVALKPPELTVRHGTTSPTLTMPIEGLEFDI